MRLSFSLLRGVGAALILPLAACSGDTPVRTAGTGGQAGTVGVGGRAGTIGVGGQGGTIGVGGRAGTIGLGGQGGTIGLGGQGGGFGGMGVAGVGAGVGGTVVGPGGFGGIGGPAGMGTPPDPLTGACLVPGTLQCFGQCVDYNQDIFNCGGCGVICEPGAGCIAGACLCPPGSVDCVDACANLLTSPTDCGACGINCGPGGVCVNGQCQCPPGTQQCNPPGPATQACFTNFESDPFNCGGCGDSCAVGEICVGGQCQCAIPGQQVCDGQCTDFLNNPFDCGGCNQPCGPGGFCANGQCQCAPGQQYCPNTGCANLNMDPLSCGGCDNQCDPGALCIGGTCTCSGQTCNFNPPGPGGSQQRCVNGGFNIDPMNCGSCGNECGPGSMCLNGQCLCPPPTVACTPGGPGTVGLNTCANLLTDPLNCGTCGTACASGATCAGGVCQCPPGLTACPHGCVNTMTNPQDCGICNNACPSGGDCLNGQCLPCPPGRQFCGGGSVQTAEGCRLSTPNWEDTDPFNCGMCGFRCPRGAHCEGGQCICPPGEINCGRFCALPGHCPEYAQCTRNPNMGGGFCRPNGQCRDNDVCCRRSASTGSWCADPCSSNAECPPAPFALPVPNPAVPVCQDIGGGRCALDCTFGRQCPLGMRCRSVPFGGGGNNPSQICTW